MPQQVDGIPVIQVAVRIHIAIGGGADGLQIHIVHADPVAVWQLAPRQAILALLLGIDLHLRATGIAGDFFIRGAGATADIHQLCGDYAFAATGGLISGCINRIAVTGGNCLIPAGKFKIMGFIDGTPGVCRGLDCLTVSILGRAEDRSVMVLEYHGSLDDFHLKGCGFSFIADRQCHLAQLFIAEAGDHIGGHGDIFSSTVGVGQLQGAAHHIQGILHLHIFHLIGQNQHRNGAQCARSRVQLYIVHADPVAVGKLAPGQTAAGLLFADAYPVAGPKGVFHTVAGAGATADIDHIACNGAHRARRGFRLGAVHDLIVIRIGQADPSLVALAPKGIARAEGFRDGQLGSHIQGGGHRIIGAGAGSDFHFGGHRYFDGIHHRALGKLDDLTLFILPLGIQHSTVGQRAVQDCDLLAAAGGGEPTGKGIAGGTGAEIRYDARRLVDIIAMDHIADGAAVAIQKYVLDKVRHAAGGVVSLIHAVYVEVGFAFAPGHQDIIRIGLAPQKHTVNQSVALIPGQDGFYKIAVSVPHPARTAVVGEGYQGIKFMLLQIQVMLQVETVDLGFKIIQLLTEQDFRFFHSHGIFSSIVGFLALRTPGSVADGPLGIVPIGNGIKALHGLDHIDQFLGGSQRRIRVRLRWLCCRFCRCGGFRRLRRRLCVCGVSRRGYASKQAQHQRKGQKAADPSFRHM